jgi:hypothetical protein
MNHAALCTDHIRMIYLSLPNDEPCRTVHGSHWNGPRIGYHPLVITIESEFLLGPPDKKNWWPLPLSARFLSPYVPLSHTIHLPWEDISLVFSHQNTHKQNVKKLMHWHKSVNKKPCLIATASPGQPRHGDESDSSELHHGQVKCPKNHSPWDSIFMSSTPKSILILGHEVPTIATIQLGGWGG